MAGLLKLLPATVILGVGAVTLVGTTGVADDNSAPRSCLVFLTDTSSSVSDDDFKKMMQGMASALRNKQVQDALAKAGPVKTFGIFYSRTHHGDVLEYTLNLVEKHCSGLTVVIDHVTDGMTQPATQEPKRDEMMRLAKLAGYTINVLAVLTKGPGNGFKTIEALEDYAEKYLIANGGRVFGANSVDEFEEAMRQKLSYEISSLANKNLKYAFAPKSKDSYKLAYK